MPLHVKNGSCAEFRRHETLIELVRIIDLSNQRIWNYLAGFVILGVHSQYLRLESPVLIELRERLNEIASHVSPAHRCIVAFREEPVKGMAELMECCLDLIDREHCRSGIGRSRKIADIDYDWSHVVALSVHILLAEVCHPSPASLSGTREVVGHEYS